MPTPLNFPVAYRLVESNDGSGNDVPALQGLFLEFNHNTDKIQGFWRALDPVVRWASDGDPFTFGE